MRKIEVAKMMVVVVIAAVVAVTEVAIINVVRVVDVIGVAMLVVATGTTIAQVEETDSVSMGVLMVVVVIEGSVKTIVTKGITLLAMLIVIMAADMVGLARVSMIGVTTTTVVDVTLMAATVIKVPLSIIVIRTIATHLIMTDASPSTTVGLMDAPVTVLHSARRRLQRDLGDAIHLLAVPKTLGLPRDLGDVIRMMIVFTIPERKLVLQWWTPWPMVSLLLNALE